MPTHPAGSNGTAYPHCHSTLSLLLALTSVLSLVGCAPGSNLARNPTQPDPTPVVVLPDESGYTPSPQDGGGTVTVTPSSVVSAHPCTLTFTYTAGAKGVSSGGGVLCYVSSFWGWAPPQHRSSRHPGFATVTCSDPDVTLQVTADPGSKTVLAAIGEQPLLPGDQLVFTYGDTSGGAEPGARGTADRFAEHGEQFFFKVDGDGDGFFTPVTAQPSFTVAAGPAALLYCRGPSTVEMGESFEVRLSVLDRAYNRASGFVGELELQLDPSLVAGQTRVSLTPSDEGSVGVTLTALGAGVTFVQVHDTARQLQSARSNVIVVNQPGQRRYRLVWADLHMHGNLSDGTGTAADLYRYARDVAGLDAAALTEHDHWGHLSLYDNTAGWSAAVATTAGLNHPGEFVTFFGYEYTNWTTGHQHVLFSRREELAVRAWDDPATDHVQELFAALAGSDSIAIPHHPGGGPIPYCWKYHEPSLQPVVEITSIHGSSERDGAAGGIYHPVSSGMVQTALARGYRLGFVGSGDTHDGHPGIGSPGSPPPGLAGIYAEELSRDAIFAALRARRVYATSGCRAVLRFSCGDTPMGGVQPIAELTGPVELRVIVAGDAPIASVTVVKDNRDVAVIPGSGVLEALTWRDPEPPTPGSYYYVRVAQTDNGMLWSSPIWLE